MRRKFILSAVFLFALLCVGSLASAENEASIAVAAENSSPDSPISMYAAHSPYFLLFDEKGEFVEALANPMRGERRGVGPKVVEFLSDKGVRAFIAGEFGGRTVSALKQNKMVFHTDTGSAADAVRRMQKQ